MARLPTALDLSGQESLRSGRVIASQDTSAVGRGMQSLGADVMGVAGTMAQVEAQRRQQSNLTGGITADGQSMKDMDDFTRTFDTATDYDKFPERFDKGAQAIAERAAQHIQDPTARQLWLGESEKRKVAARSRVLDLAQSRAGEAQLVNARSGLEGYQTVLANPDAPEGDRDYARKNGLASIEALQQSGRLSPAQAEDWRRSFVEGGDFVLGQREVERDPEIITGKLPAAVSDRASAAMQFFQGKGYTKEQAAGIVGNLVAESKLQPSGAVGDNGTAFGIAQWRGERLNQLKRYAASRGQDWTSFQTQLEFIDVELNGDERAAGSALRAAKTIDEAAAAFIGFERPRGWTKENPRGGHNYKGRVTYAAQAAGEVVRPEWFNNLPPERQFAIEQRAAAQQRQNETEAAAQLRAAQAQRNNDFRLRIETPDIGLTRQEILDDPLLDDGNRASLLNSFDAANKDNIAAGAIISAIGSGQKVPINGFDADQRRIADKGYEQFLRAVPEDQRDLASRAYIESTGYIPTPVQSAVRYGAASKDPAQFTSAMSLADALERAAPTSFNAFEGGAGVRDQLATFRHFVNDLGMSGDEAARRALALNDPAMKQSRAILKPEADKFVKTLTVSDVTDSFDQGIRYSEPGAGLMPVQQNRLLGEYRELAESHFYETGDKGVAKARALADIKSRWGVNTMSGSPNLMRYPPEMRYPPIGGSFDYLREDAMKTAQSYVDDMHPGRTVTNVAILDSEQTRRDIEAKRLPRYRLFYAYEQDGQTLFDEAAIGTWGLNEAQVDKRKNDLSESRRQEFERSRARESDINVVERAAEQNAERAMSETVGPDWMKARAAEAERERGRVSADQRRARREPDAEAERRAKAEEQEMRQKVGEWRSRNASGEESATARRRRTISETPIGGGRLPE